MSKKTNHVFPWATFAVISLCGVALSNPTVWLDPADDAVVRRTDPGNNDPITTGNIPDLLLVSLVPWEPYDPVTDPYTGQQVDPANSHMFKLDIVFKGLMNPPGPVDPAGFNHNPLEFGPNPIYGHINIDVDGDDTGGVLDNAAYFVRYLANSARFGSLPGNPINARAAITGDDVDYDYDTPPQTERNGVDFTISMCGCSTLQIVEEGGDGDGIFDEGETWIISGRTFMREFGYKEACDSYFGSDDGLYDPFTETRFSHSTVTDMTTLTLVFPLDMTGAAMLTGEPEQPIDLDVSNHVSIVEALDDVIYGAGKVGLPYPVRDIIDGWRNRDPFDYLDVTQWNVTFLVGTAYTSPDVMAVFAWTDIGFDNAYGDVDGDGTVDSVDETIVVNTIYADDGGPDDEDGEVNGSVDLINFGPYFSLYDVNGDGYIDIGDEAVYGPLADMDGDGTVESQDFVMFLNAFVAGDLAADINRDGVVNSKDFSRYLNEFVAG
jgi:hypothetical protein